MLNTLNNRTDHDQSLADRVALVIGGASGIGLASGLAMAQRGACVLLADKEGSAAEAAASQTDPLPGKVEAFQTDASSTDDLRELFSYVDRKFGKLNILFCNVGATGPNEFDLTEEAFDAVIDLNLKSHYFATNLAAPIMRRCAGEASVIYMSSAAALRAGSPSPLYSISKSGVLMMMRCFARELGPDGIRVNAVCPGHIVTRFSRNWLNLPDADYRKAIEDRARRIPLGRVGQVQDVANVVTFLASDQSGFITGQAIAIDGGASA